jgi:hypothetical protein
MRQQLLCRYIPQQRSTKTQLAHSNKNFNNSFVSLLHFLLSKLHDMTASFALSFHRAASAPPPIACLQLSNAHLGASPAHCPAWIYLRRRQGGRRQAASALLLSASTLQVHQDKTRMNFFRQNISIFSHLKVVFIYKVNSRLRAANQISTAFAFAFAFAFAPPPLPMLHVRNVRCVWRKFRQRRTASLCRALFGS